MWLLHRAVLMTANINVVFPCDRITELLISSAKRNWLMKLTLLVLLLIDNKGIIHEVNSVPEAQLTETNK